MRKTEALTWHTFCLRKERKTTGHVMTARRYPRQQRSDIAKESSLGITNREKLVNLIRVVIIFLRYELQCLLSGVRPLFQNQNYRLQRTLHDVLFFYQVTMETLSANNGLHASIRAPSLNTHLATGKKFEVVLVIHSTRYSPATAASNESCNGSKPKVLHP